MYYDTGIYYDARTWPMNIKFSNVHIWSHLAQFYLECEMFHIKVVQNIEMHILCPVTSFLSRKSCTLWGNVEKNNVEPDGLQMMIWCIRTACWMPKATNAHSEFVIRTAFPPQDNPPQCYCKRTLSVSFPLPASISTAFSFILWNQHGSDNGFKTPVYTLDVDNDNVI
jgi:hypothetical protein